VNHDGSPAGDEPIADPAARRAALALRSPDAAA
jgi:hypothetical protein